MELITKLKISPLVQISEQPFVLKSGQKSNFYFDFKGLNSYPELVSEISYELSKFISDKNVCIAGVPLGGITYATIISQLLNLPLVLIREDKKEYGTCQQIEGNTFGKDLILIEDVITTGSSTIKTLNILKENNIKVRDVICILDREAGGIQELLKMGYTTKSLFKLSTFFNHKVSSRNIKITNNITKKLINIINDKKTNLIASLDIDNANELLDMIGLIGTNVCAVKIHYDTLYNIPDDFIERINKLKYLFNLLIIEDRKFADIPYISQKQIVPIKQFADIVTVHGICGEKLIEELDKENIGLLLVHKLSIEKNLIDNNYTYRVRDMATKYKNIVGFVSQDKVLNDYLTFTPGVNLLNSTDNKGQTYRTIDNINTDIFIVGRGIYESSTICDTAKSYQTKCYEHWKFK